MAAGLGGCVPRGSGSSAAALDTAAGRYTLLVLQMGRHDADYVDAYFGPADRQAEAERDSLSLGRIVAVGDSLRAALGERAPRGADEMTTLRHRFLRRQLAALVARARMLQGDTLSFDQESQALYDVVAPPVEEAMLQRAVARLDSLLPGQGPLAERYERFREGFSIPAARVDTVFKTAIAESRARTRAHMALPDSESFTLEFVHDKPWSGYNWYQGRYHSLIQINLDQPIALERVLDVACHEGYPGHHVYNMLLEQALVERRGWQEFTVYPLYSPLSLIAEGTAVVAQDVAFPRAERAEFEQRTLMPLAGMDASRYERYAQVRAAMDSLAGATLESTRSLLEHRLTREEAIAWNMRYALSTRSRAEQQVRFGERYRSYVVNYDVGKRLVRVWLAAHGGDDSHPERRWELYQQLLAKPALPEDLR
jgi:hypothetical protein